VITGNAQSGLAAFNSATVSLVNVLLAGNFSPFEGSAIRTYGSEINLINTTVAANRSNAQKGVGAIQLNTATLRARNSILWGNSLPSIFHYEGDGSTVEVAFCLVEGGWEGEGNIDADPLFAANGEWDDGGTPDSDFDDTYLGGDFRLRADSPAIDAGTADGASEFDIEGRARPCEGGFDLGAYEFCGAGEPVLFRRGDANADARFDISDGVFILGWLFTGGKTPSCLEAADTDDSGLVNITDAIALFGHLFLGGAEPRPPFSACGADPTPGGAGCRFFPPCEE
jgi:hypothetical protein